MKIAVIGTGIAGLTAALEAVNHGSVTVFSDPNRPPASRCAGGMIAPYSESDTLDLDLQALAVRHSLPYWKELAEKHAIHYAENGTLVVAHEADSGYLKRFQTHLPQGTYELLNKQDLTEKESLLARRYNGGLWVYDEAYMDTAQMLNAMKAEIAKSAEIIAHPFPENYQDYDLIIEATGRSAKIEGMRTVKGERILLRCPDIKLSHCVRIMHPRYPLYIVPHAQNIFMVGATMIEDNESDEFSLRSAMELMSAFTSLGAQVLESDIIAMETGHRPAFTNHRPRIIREGKKVQVNGVYRHGFLLAPVLAKAIFSDDKELKVFEEKSGETVH